MAIRKCTCENAFQDKKYGKGMRVMNPTTKGQGNQKGWRCTVCKAEQISS